MPAKKAVAKKTTARRATAKKTTAKKTTVKKTTVKKTTVKRPAAIRAALKKTVGTKSTGASRPNGAARKGDLIVVDSPQVGAAPREGEVLKVIRGEVGISYRVRWTDGHETLIAPKGGVARIVPASTRA